MVALVVFVAVGIALVVYAFAHGGTAAIGIVSLVILIPAAVIAPAGSIFGDRYRRERVYRYCEATMALFCALTSFSSSVMRSCTSRLLGAFGGLSLCGSEAADLSCGRLATTAQRVDLTGEPGQTLAPISGRTDERRQPVLLTSLGVFAAAAMGGRSL